MCSNTTYCSALLAVLYLTFKYQRGMKRCQYFLPHTNRCSQLRDLKWNSKEQKPCQPGPQKANLGVRQVHTQPHLGSAAAPGVLLQKEKLPSRFQYTVFTVTFPPAGVQDSSCLGWCHCEERHSCSRHVPPRKPTTVKRGRHTLAGLF